MRFLAVDLGAKRTGLAVGDDGSRIVTPAGAVYATTDPQRLAGVARAIDEHGPDRLVVGLPLNMDGSLGPAAVAAKRFAAALERHARLPVDLQDERLTSAAADAQMARSGLTHAQKKARRDSLAAAALLRDYLAARASRDAGVDRAGDDAVGAGDA